MRYDSQNRSFQICLSRDDGPAVSARWRAGPGLVREGNVSPRMFLSMCDEGRLRLLASRENRDEERS